MHSFSRYSKAGQQTVMVLMMVVAISIAVSVALSLVLARFAVKPMFALESAMQALSEGDLRMQLETGSKDEVGRMVNAMSKTVMDLNSIVTNIYGGTETLSTQAESVAQTADGIHDVSTRKNKCTTITTSSFFPLGLAR